MAGEAVLSARKEDALDDWPLSAGADVCGPTVANGKTTNWSMFT
jgi:hypothetical protein